MDFNKRLQIGVNFAKYCGINKVILPNALSKRRKIFIDWYIHTNDNRDFNEVFNELADEVLYLARVTLTRIMFNEK